MDHKPGDVPLAKAGVRTDPQQTLGPVHQHPRRHDGVFFDPPIAQAALRQGVPQGVDHDRGAQGEGGAVALPLFRLCRNDGFFVWVPSVVACEGIEGLRRAVPQGTNEEPGAPDRPVHQDAEGVVLGDLQGVETAELLVGPGGGSVAEGRGFCPGPEAPAGLGAVQGVQVLAEAAPLMQRVECSVGVKEGSRQHR